MKKIITIQSALSLLVIMAFAGCSLISESEGAAVIRAYYRHAENNKPEEMVKLYSKRYLANNPRALENSRSISETIQRLSAKGTKQTLSDMKETIEGDKMVVKGLRNFSDGGPSLPFETPLVKENGEWKIDDINH